MKLDSSILVNIRESVGLMGDNSEFDTDLLIHINSTIATLAQIGACDVVIVSDDTTQWRELKNESLVGSNMFMMVPTYVALSTKLIFDPPPPSAVEIYKQKADEILWRLKIANE